MFYLLESFSLELVVCASYDADYLSQLIFPPDSVLLTFESIYWTSGINPIVSVMQNSSGIKRIITAKPFSPELQLKLIEKYKISALCNSPSKLIACVKNDGIKQMKLLSVKDIMLYGNKVPCNLVNEAIQYFPNAKFRSLYGMTEIGIISISTLDVHSPTNCGRLFPGKTAKIIDESGNRCGPDVSGEICVQQKHQFLGYLGDSKATAAVIDYEGFYRTGDRGHFDGNGRFWFEDRIKNIIRVYYFSAVLIPTEIEDFLLRIPDILDVCVVGIPAGVGTAIPAALVVKKTDSNLSHHDVFNTIAGETFFSEIDFTVRFFIMLLFSHRKLCQLFETTWRSLFCELIPKNAQWKTNSRRNHQIGNRIVQIEKGYRRSR